MATAQLCVLCGINPASSGQGDHIPPKSLYTKQEKINAKYQMHTVPACTECNMKGSKHDEELKLLIGMSRGNQENQNDIIESLVGTIEKNQRLARHVFKSNHVLHQYPNEESCLKSLLYSMLIHVAKQYQGFVVQYIGKKQD